MMYVLVYKRSKRFSRALLGLSLAMYRFVIQELLGKGRIYSQEGPAFMRFTGIRASLGIAAMLIFGWHPALHAQTPNWITTYAGVGVIVPAGMGCGLGAFGTCASITIYPTGYSGDGGLATEAMLGGATGLAFDSSGNLFIAVGDHNRIRKITADSIISTIAGTGARGFSGDGGPATSAAFNDPMAVAVDSIGNVFVADSDNYRVRKIDLNGIITTVAGGGNPITSASGKATGAIIHRPLGLAFDHSGNLLICTLPTSLPGVRILQVDQTDTLSTVAQVPTVWDADGCGLTVDSAGNIFFASAAQVFKKATNGQISLVAGTGANSGNNNEGAPATGALLANPTGLAFDAAGNLLMVEDFGPVQKIDPSGIITSIVGGHGLSWNGAIGDFGPAASASFYSVHGLAIDSDGSLYIADPSMDRIRKIAAEPASSLPLEIPFSKSLSQITSNDASSLKTGYGALVSTSGLSAATGIAIFGYHADGALVSEAGVPATPLIQSGRIFAEINGSVDTGVAIVNPYDTTAQVSFFFTDANGHDTGNGTTTVAAKSKLSVYLTDAPYNGPSPFVGTFTFTSSLPVGVVALRLRANERGEYLMTTLPATDLQAPAGSTPVVFPHYADGAGWSTEIALVNTGDAVLTGSVQFLDPTGAPAAVSVNGRAVSTFTYSIPPRGSQSWQTSGPDNAVDTGTIVVTPTGGQAAPVGVSMFAFRIDGVTVTEAGVPSTPVSTAFRVYAEADGNFPDVGSIESGFALSNPSGSPVTVTIELDALNGLPATVPGPLIIPPGGQTALMLDQLPGISALSITFMGALRIRSGGPISVVGLRIRVNERGELVITTTPPTDESANQTAITRFFPHVVDSGGFTTQFVLFSAGSSPFPAGLLELFDASGGPLGVTLH